MIIHHQLKRDVQRWQHCTKQHWIFIAFILFRVPCVCQKIASIITHVRKVAETHEYKSHACWSHWWWALKIRLNEYTNKTQGTVRIWLSVAAMPSHIVLYCTYIVHRTYVSTEIYMNKSIVKWIMDGCITLRYSRILLSIFARNFPFFSRKQIIRQFGEMEKKTPFICYLIVFCLFVFFSHIAYCFFYFSCGVSFANRTQNWQIIFCSPTLTPFIYRVRVVYYSWSGVVRSTGHLTHWKEHVITEIVLIALFVPSWITEGFILVMQ